MHENMVVFTFQKQKIRAGYIFSVSEWFSMFPSCISYQGCFSALWQQNLAEVTEEVLGCDAAQQANLSKSLMQPLVGWESRLKVTSIF